MYEEWQLDTAQIKFTFVNKWISAIELDNLINIQIKYILFCIN